MRVAVRHADPEHPNAGWFAYGLGRAEDFVHPVPGETSQKADVVSALLARAQAEYVPEQGYEHQVQTLTEAGEWIPVEQVAEQPLAPEGEVVEVGLEAAHEQAANAVEVAEATPEPEPQA